MYLVRPGSVLFGDQPGTKSCCGSIFAATYRDAYSGGTVRCYHIDESGWTRVSEMDSMELYFKFKEA